VIAYAAAELVRGEVCHRRSPTEHRSWPARCPTCGCTQAARFRFYAASRRNPPATPAGPREPHPEPERERRPAVRHQRPRLHRPRRLRTQRCPVPGSV